MLPARKSSSRRFFPHTWKAYFSVCGEMNWHSRTCVVYRILLSLQQGVVQALALRTVRSQISALAVYFQRPLAAHSLIRTFVQGIRHVAPPVRPPLPSWDLNLVLSALQRAPFEDIREIPLLTLSQKVVFLVAITSIRRVSELAALSCKAPYLVIHQDKAVLRPQPSFLPKVVSGLSH